MQVCLGDSGGPLVVKDMSCPYSSAVTILGIIRQEGRYSGQR
jgi:hypothetical protein